MEEQEIAEDANPAEELVSAVENNESVDTVSSEAETANNAAPPATKEPMTFTVNGEDVEVSYAEMQKSLASGKGFDALNIKTQAFEQTQKQWEAGKATRENELLANYQKEAAAVFEQDYLPKYREQTIAEYEKLQAMDDHQRQTYALEQNQQAQENKLAEVRASLEQQQATHNKELQNRDTEIMRLQLDGFLGTMATATPIAKNDYFKSLFVQGYASALESGLQPDLKALFASTEKTFTEKMLGYYDSQSPDAFRELLGDKRLNKLLLQKKAAGKKELTKTASAETVDKSSSNDGDYHA